MRVLPVLAGLACLGGPVVTPEWVRQARERLGGRLVVLEASWTPEGVAKEYQAGHIPGAFHVNTDVFEKGSPSWHLRPLAELQEAIGALGIGPETTVVVYSAKTIAAARVWWILEYAGVREALFLDGGLAAWARAGLPVETTPRTPVRTRFSAKPRKEVLAGTEDVKRRRGAALVDVRSEAEFRGEVSGYSYLNAKGRIPGAIAAGNADDSQRLYQKAGGTLRSAAEIRELWTRAGVPLDGELIFYCGGGWRSSLAFLYARLLGLKRIRNYSDGWSGWSTVYGAGGTQSASGNPVERGLAEKPH